MGETRNEAAIFYKKYIEPFVALFILAFLVTGCILLWQDNQLKEDISQNCGWETEDYQCYCDEATVSKMHDIIDNYESQQYSFGEQGVPNINP